MSNKPLLTAKLYAIDGMAKTEIKGNGVLLVREDGVEVELTYARSCNEIRLAINGTLAILPIASNRVNIERNAL